MVRVKHRLEVTDSHWDLRFHFRMQFAISTESPTTAPDVFASWPHAKPVTQMLQECRLRMNEVEMFLPLQGSAKGSRRARAHFIPFLSRTPALHPLLPLT